MVVVVKLKGFLQSGGVGACKKCCSTFCTLPHPHFVRTPALFSSLWLIPIWVIPQDLKDTDLKRRRQPFPGSGSDFAKIKGILTDLLNGARGHMRLASQVPFVYASGFDQLFDMPLEHGASSS